MEMPGKRVCFIHVNSSSTRADCEAHRQSHDRPATTQPRSIFILMKHQGGGGVRDSGQDLFLDGDGSCQRDFRHIDLVAQRTPPPHGCLGRHPKSRRGRGGCSLLLHLRRLHLWRIRCGRGAMLLLLRHRIWLGRDGIWRGPGGCLLLHLALVLPCTVRPAILMPAVRRCSPRKKALDQKIPASRPLLSARLEKLPRGVVHAAPTLVVEFSNPALGPRGLVLQLEVRELEEVPRQVTSTKWIRSVQLSLAHLLQHCPSASWWGYPGGGQRALVSAGNGQRWQAPARGVAPRRISRNRAKNAGQGTRFLAVSPGNSENNGSRGVQKAAVPAAMAEGCSR